MLDLRTYKSGKKYLKVKIKKFLSFYSKIRIVKRSYKERLIDNLKFVTKIQILDATKMPIKVLFNSIELEVNTLEEAFILKELLNDNDYYFHLDKNIVLIDIGMNVGFTSLYLANKDEVKHVYSYEPVEETYKMAKANLNFNPEIASKIKAYNFGLGSEDCKRKFIYSKEYKGSVGVRGLKSWNIRQAKDTKIIEVEIRNASTVLEEIIQRHNDHFFVCKIDCEGGEYEIVNNLFSSNLIQNIGMFIIEYHDVGPDVLQDVFFKKGFITIIKKTAPHLGIIYAFNTQISNN